MAEVVLTREQQAVVDHRGGNLLVSAAAGSGKTKVLVERLMGFLCDADDPASVDEFLMITYTKAAAAELRARISQELSHRLAITPSRRHLQRQLIAIGSAQISTVHAFCAALLREHAHRIDQPSDFRVLEQGEADQMRQLVVEQTLDEAYQDLPNDPARQELFDTLGAGRDDRALPGLILSLYEQVCCHADPDEWMQSSERRMQIDPTVDASETPWGDYLIRNLHTVLENAMQRMRRAVQHMQGDVLLEKAYLPIFLQNLQAFEELRRCESWDAVSAFGLPVKGRLVAVRNHEDPALLERLKAVRAESFAQIEAACAPLLDPSAVVIEDLLRSGAALGALFALIRAFRSRYQAEKARIRAMDFSDLEQNTLRLLCTRSGQQTELARQIAARYREIMVDEYQDSNEVQEAIFRAVSNKDENRFLVGDVKQSIYRFRLADPTVFLNKYRDYPALEPGNDQKAAKILLSQNFRSRPEVLDAVNDVFCGVMSEQVGDLTYGEDEALRAGRTMLPLDGPVVELHCMDTESVNGGAAMERAEAEAVFVAGRISRMLTEGTQIEDGGALRAVRPEDIVILMRSPRASAAKYLAALWSLGIPCSFDQAGSLLDTMEVQMLRAILQVVDNPLQDIPLAAVLMSPVFCFSASELALLRAAAPRESLYTALKNSRGQEKCAAFLDDLEQLRALRALLPLEDFLEELLRKLEYEALCSALPDGAIRCANLRAFCALITAAQQRGEPLAQFLADLDAMQEQGRSIPAASTSAGGVRIMSTHSSKGLEFPVVVLADLCHQFNMEDLRAQVLTHPQWGIGSMTVDMQKRIRYPTIARTALALLKKQEMRSEELRILYVAMTRARERLIMTCCANGMEKKLKKFALEAEYPVPPEMAAAVNAPADWVLLSAITRTDAAALHLDDLRPPELRVADSRWHIEFHRAGASGVVTDAAVAEAQEEKQTSWPEEQELVRALQFSYPHAAATRLPAKLTATQLKGRSLDDEISDGMDLLPAAPAPKLPKPDFAQQKALTPTERGTAMHQFMQFADYSACTDPAALQQELRRLCELEFLTEQQIEAVQAEKVLTFFRSPLGQQVLHSKHLVREFKFSVLMPAYAFDPDCPADEVLLQGVVDCCLDEPEGLTILDFKTDHISPGREVERAAYYRGQLQAYSAALERIFSKPVLRRVIWFFATDSEQEV